MECARRILTDEMALDEALDAIAAEFGYARTQDTPAATSSCLVERPATTRCLDLSRSVGSMV